MWGLDYGLAVNLSCKVQTNCAPALGNGPSDDVGHGPDWFPDNLEGAAVPDDTDDQRNLGAQQGYESFGQL